MTKLKNTGEYLRKWRKENPGSSRQYHVKKTYGMTLTDYNILLEQQGGRCMICKRTDPAKKGTKNFYIDHDHKTGKVRGLLCHFCNTGLGYFGDSVETLQRAQDYLNGTLNGCSKA